MSIIKCPECGRRISDAAEACIHCGYPMKAKATLNEKQNSDTPVAISAVSGDNSLPTTDGTALQDSGLPLKKSSFISKSKSNLLIAGGALLLILAALSFYLFYYRPHFVPQTVENANYTIQCNGDTYHCSFTGTMLNQKPQGAGRFECTDDNSSTVFEGELTDGKTFTEGEVSNLPVIVETYAGQFESFYSGTVAGGELIDAYNVATMPLSVEFDGKTYNGLYTGEIKQGTPNGTGSFTYENKDKYFEYTGAWQDGKLKGEGQLSSNDIVVHFQDVDRKGVYSGSVEDGVFCGQGTFSAITDDGINYTYEGEWKDGKWDGQGKQIFNNAEKKPNCLGTFQNGEFTPTLLEFLTSLGTEKNALFTISEKAQDFITQNTNLFLENSAEGISDLVDKNFRYTDYSKNSSKFGDKLFRVTNFSIVQVFEYSDYWGKQITKFLGYDSNFNVYSGYLFTQSDKIVEDKYITLYALPLDFSTYKGVNNNSIWAIRFIAVYVE